MVAEGSIQIKGQSCAHPNFQLIFSSCVRDYFPEMLARIETGTSNSRPKNISRLFQNHKGTIILKL